MSKAEAIAELFEDGQSFEAADGRSLDEVCTEAGADVVRDGDQVRYEFVDGSVLTAVGGGWDLGFSGCWCWRGANGGRHVDGCHRA